MALAIDTLETHMRLHERVCSIQKPGKSRSDSIIDLTDQQPNDTQLKKPRNILDHRIEILNVNSVVQLDDEHSYCGFCDSITATNNPCNCTK
jgi:hypothetical protein